MFEISLTWGGPWAPAARVHVPLPPFKDVPGLLAGFREGDPRALSTVYLHYARSVDGYLRALAYRAGTPELRQASAVADLVQEAFLRAFSPSARLAYDGLRDFGPYLNTIARNCFIDTLRKQWLEVPLGSEDLPDEAAGHGVADDGDAGVVTVLEAYLRDLAGPEKRVYEMRYVLGRTQQSTCDALGLSRRSLRTAEERLRKGLRKALFMAGVDAARGPTRSARLRGRA